MFALRQGGSPRTSASDPRAPYALPRGVPALEADPVRRRRLLVGGGTLLALIAGVAGFGVGQQRRNESSALEGARATAFVEDGELRSKAALVLSVAPKVPDDADVATALDRLARLALAERGDSGTALAGRLLSALDAGARGLAVHRLALERRFRGR